MNINNNLILILIFINIILLISLFNRSNKETFITSSTLDNEATQNLASLYQSGNFKVTNLTITGNLNGGFNYLPIGTIVSWYDPSGNFSKIPSNWALCDGTNNTPDLRGRFILGSCSTPIKDNSGNIIINSRIINSTGGEENHKLTIDELPSHSHNYRFSLGSRGPEIGSDISMYDASGNLLPWDNIYKGYRTVNYTNFGGLNNVLFSIPANTNLMGNNRQHNNMPPFYVLAYIMKIS